MKKMFKNPLLTFILGAIIFGGIVGVSAYTILANDIGYTPSDTTWKKSNGEDITNVKDAIDELYNKANSNKNQTVCMLLSGTKNTVSAKYHCNLGDGELRNFYVLAVNGDTVKLIMERNITDTVGSNATMSWNDAIQFFDEEHDGYTLKQTWLTTVQSVDLPDAQDIANAGGITGLDISKESHIYFGGNVNTRSNYAWLYNYSTNCTSAGCSVNGVSPGYWTKSSLNASSGWCVSWDGMLESYSGVRGVRPVITISKSKLAG